MQKNLNYFDRSIFDGFFIVKYDLFNQKSFLFKFLIFT